MHNLKSLVCVCGVVRRCEVLFLDVQVQDWLLLVLGRGSAVGGCMYHRWVGWVRGLGLESRLSHVS